MDNKHIGSIFENITYLIVLKSESIKNKNLINNNIIYSKGFRVSQGKQ